MKKRKKLKLKKGPSIILFLIIFILLAYITVERFFLNITLIGDNNINLNLGQEYFENGYKATCFFKKCDNVEIKDNIDSSKEGTYKVTYKLSFGFINKKKERTIIVKDLNGPELSLEGDTHLYLSKNTPYEEPGYKAVSKSDGDLSKAVTTSGTVNEKEEGTYTITYEVKDSKGNTTKKTRTIDVIDNAIMDIPIENFNLNNYYKENILTYEDTLYDQIKDVIFLGDSNTVYLNERGGYIPKDQIWGKYNLSIAAMRTSSFTTFADGKTVSLKEALDTYKPKILIVSGGIDSVLHMNEEDYKKEAELFIKYFKDNYPNVNLVITSILPIYHGSVGLWHQKEINAFNFDMLELCHKYNINFINFADEVKDETGGASKEYFDCLATNDCGFHLNNAGKEKYIDYLKHVNLERKIK